MSTRTPVGERLSTARRLSTATRTPTRLMSSGGRASEVTRIIEGVGGEGRVSELGMFEGKRDAGVIVGLG